jgi:2-polyprenyl-3-methyl-5-hydroxy-6-metoxy-1,4-benzoquinol methylase
MTATTETLVTPQPDTLQRLLSENWWYHRMNLGGGRTTPGKYGDNLIPVAYLMKHVDLTGMKCLDIGAMDGKMSFLMERLGGNVLSVDGVGKATVPGLIDAFGSTVRYQRGVILENLPELLSTEGLFDFVLCSGVAYHVYSPFDLIANVRQLLKNGGLALFETAALVDDENMYMALNRGDMYNEHTTLWIPTTACFRYMLRFLSLRVLGEAELRMHDYRVVRHTWLVQAEKPSMLTREVDDSWLATLLGRQAPGLSHEFLKPQFDHDRFEALPQSSISASPVSASPVFRLEEPHGWAEEAALLAEGTPAWRVLPEDRS